VALATGTRLGPYEISAPLGRGGMGEVYKARDTRLDRFVAIKVLSEALAADAQFLARFDREARAISQLTHPHICALYDVGQHDRTAFLVMEYLEGETLADRLTQGALPISEALPIAIQISSALAEAHQAAIVHRDLKPGNIMLTRSGAKLLDFGLAKSGSPTVTRGSVSAFPTTPDNITVQGTVLGTIQYMSPEQIEGADTDARTDIFAFGAVVYEMVTGRKAFEAKSHAGLIGAILKDQPQPLSAMLPIVPPLLESVVQACLKKDPRGRWQSADDLRAVLQWIADNRRASANGASPDTPTATRIFVPIVAAIAAAAATGLLLWRGSGSTRATTPQGPEARFSIALAADHTLSNLEVPSLALAPDGSRLVFVGGSPSQLYVRNINETVAKPIAGTDGAGWPFFSPDGNWVAFFAGNTLRKIALDGGEAVTVCSNCAGNPRGGAWSDDGTIAFAPVPGSALFRIDAAGGQPKPLTILDAKAGEGAHRSPDFLPGGKAVLFTIGTAEATSWDDGQIAVQSLATGTRRVLAQGHSPRYAPSGHLLYVRQGTLMAVPFDVRRLELTGTTVRVVEGVAQSAFGATQFSLSANGSLVYVAGGVSERELVWVARDGSMEALPTPPRGYWSVRMSPEGQRLAISIEAANYDVWTYDLGRGSLTRLTAGGTNAWPVWTPDGTRITFNTTRDSGFLNLFWKPADGGGAEERLTTSDAVQVADSWSPDGRILAFEQFAPPTGSDIWMVERDPPRKAWPFLQTPFVESGPAFSPDGRWIAYTSNESGSFNVHVRSFAGVGANTVVSAGGGSAVSWSPNGRELFFRSGDRMMVADVESGSTLRVGKPRQLFAGNFAPAGNHLNYAVSPDGQRFVMIRTRDKTVRRDQIQIVLNWVAQLKARASVR